MCTEAVDSAFDLDAYLGAERRAVDSALRRLTGELLRDVAPEAAAPIRYALEAGGKRLRPILCVAAYRAARSWAAAPDAEAYALAAAGNGRRTGSTGAAAGGIYELAAALELVHTYSLVHDDLPCMDDDELRRGRPTTHLVYGVERAMTAGAALIPLACLAAGRGAHALGLTPAERMSLVRELCAAAGAGGMVGGQLLDLEAEGRRVELDELERIHRRKTGALLIAALRMGGRAARANAAVLDALSAYGRAVGLAFQIADDVLDVTGRAAELGKTAGRDQVLAKATFPARLGVAEARRRARAEADAAVRVLRRADMASPALEALAHFAAERDR